MFSTKATNRWGFEPTSPTRAPFHLQSNALPTEIFPSGKQNRTEKQIWTLTGRGADITAFFSAGFIPGFLPLASPASGGLPRIPLVLGGPEDSGSLSSAPPPPPLMCSS